MQCRVVSGLAILSSYTLIVKCVCSRTFCTDVEDRMYIFTKFIILFAILCIVHNFIGKFICFFL